MRGLVATAILIVAISFVPFGLSTSAFALPTTMPPGEHIFAPDPNDALSRVLVYAPEKYRAQNLPPWMISTAETIASVIRQFLGNAVPSSTGLEHNNPNENVSNRFLKRLGDSNFQFMIEGVGNIKVLGGPYYYNELEGGVGVEYDFFRRDPKTGRGVMLALRVSPLYGEISKIQVSSAYHQAHGLPHRVFLGSAFGLAGTYDIGRFRPGFRIYGRPEWDISDTKRENGLSYSAAIYCRIRLSDFSKFTPGTHSALYIRPVISYYDRGAEQRDIYQWGSNGVPGLKRTAASLRKLWQGMIWLEVSY